MQPCCAAATVPFFLARSDRTAQPPLHFRWDLVWQHLWVDEARDPVPIRQRLVIAVERRHGGLFPVLVVVENNVTPQIAQ